MQTRDQIHTQINIFAEEYHRTKSEAIREDLDKRVEEYLREHASCEIQITYLAYYKIRREF